MSGEETELDKTLIEAIGDPLTHWFAIPPIMASNLLRNESLKGSRGKAPFA
jgi:hypothetical protein